MRLISGESGGVTYGTAEEEWLRVRDGDSVILATEIPFIPENIASKHNLTQSYSDNLGRQGDCVGRNGATCEDRYNTYVCKCALGFKGSNCHEVRNVCNVRDVRCVSGAPCQLTGFMSYKCLCAQGLAGKYCKTGM
ncbi:growth factor-like EGF [Desmophyllum pertusum]|uniref:Growth factor-like EGF n=1 Tax=Desmophyllum pertusum TaxID=174260 RepID=A0A9W9YXY4_9CNID|nr:growth factor-like EGF [Desmophyllum pertusum]